MLSDRRSPSGSGGEVVHDEDDEVMGEDEAEEEGYGKEVKPKKRAGRRREAGESGEGAGAGDSRPAGKELKTQAAFVHKLHSMVQTPTITHLISWSESGLIFSVPNPAEFSRLVLPQYFKHCNFNSFVRQLNMYGFHKVNDLFNNGPPLARSSVEGPIPWEFQHASFRRDRPDLLVKIKRKSSKGPNALRRRSKSASNSGSSHSSSADVGLGDGASSSKGELQYGLGGGRDRGQQQSDFRAGGLNSQDRHSSNHSAPQYPPLPRLASNGLSYPSPARSSQLSGNDDTLAAISRQLVGLETNVRGLSDALYLSQQEVIAARQEAAVERAGSYSVLRILLNVVAGMDTSGERRNDLKSAQYALEKLNPDTSYLSSNPSPSAFLHSPHPQSTSQIPTPHPPHSPRTKPTPTPSFYSRPTLPAESFARSAERANPPFQDHPHHPQPHPSSYSYPTQDYRPPPLRMSSTGEYAYRPSSSEYGLGWSGEPPLRRVSSSAGRGEGMLPPLASMLGGEGVRRGYEGEEEEARKKVRR